MRQGIDVSDDIFRVSLRFPVGDDVVHSIQDGLRRIGERVDFHHERLHTGRLASANGHPVFQKSPRTVSSGDIDETAAHDTRRLNRKDRVFGDFAPVVETNGEKCFAAGYGYAVHATDFHAGVAHRVSRLNALGFAEIAAHMEAFFAEKHHVRELKHEPREY